MLRPSARPGKPPRSLGTHVVASLILGEVQHAFPRSLREQQIRLTTPTCRTPPGQSSAIRRAPPKALLIRPGFDVTYPVTTRQQRSQTSGLRNRLPDPHLTQSSAPFPVSLTTTVFIQRSTRWFGTSRRRAVPKGLPSSLAQHRIKKPRLHDQTPLYVRGTPRALASESESPTASRSERRWMIIRFAIPKPRESFHWDCIRASSAGWRRRRQASS